MRHSGLAAIVLFSSAIAHLSCGSNPLSPSMDVTGVPGAATILEAGWSVPVKLPVSDEGWEDSSYITRDGRQVLFFYHPAHDILTNPAAATKIQLAGHIYISARPFTSKGLYALPQPDTVSEAGPYFSAGGSFFYYRTFPFGGGPNKIVRDGVLLDLGTGRSEEDPCYCDAMDELYFASGIPQAPGSPSRIQDRQIFVYKNGQANELPPPINQPGSQNMHPFLTDDCQTMYFTSTRGPSNMFSIQVFRSRRSGDLDWSVPELFVTDPGGVGEFSMTKNGREAVFIELRQDGSGVTTDIYYSSR
jgi:hypothetical protein